ncbi:MAG: 2Fe-2S iron-sulfur cluster binding domain-containing protein [Spirochaetaceae bacterium]|jgi:carbon-monoxide dehydrogenase small subunit|nr:2Fe-2S iron-sulfur cluster binding domain-containing protein [Spirochaetaceae bacterium]
MKIQITINDEPVLIDVKPDTPLVWVLRRQNLLSPKCGCGEGRCGACTVLLNDYPVPSCLVPAAAVRDARIVTLEHFAKTVVYADIQQGFSQAGVRFCGFCNAGKIFAAYELLRRTEKADRAQVIEELSAFSCQCADVSRTANGILIALNIRRRRENKEKEPPK